MPAAWSANGIAAALAAFCRRGAASISSTASPTPASTTGLTSGTAFRRCFAAIERIKEEGYATDLFGREALRFIRDNQRGPSSCTLRSTRPHGASNLEKTGVQAPKEFAAMYPESMTEKRRIYLGCITCMDTRIGEIMAELDKLGVAENTLIIFTSDNGGTSKEANGPLRGRKGQLSEGGIRVPCVARWPGRIPAGTVKHDLLTTLEFFPTLVAAAAKLPAGVKLDGYDMLDLLAGSSASPRNEMFWEHQQDHAVRIGRYKWVDAPQGKGLYDLTSDMGEKHDLSQDKPELLGRFRAKFAGMETIDGGRRAAGSLPRLLTRDTRKTKSGATFRSQ